MAASKYMWVKLVKKWGGFAVGDVIRFGRNKGEGRIKAGVGEEVKKQRAVNDPPVIENAMAAPKAERAVVDRTAKPDAKAEVKARADADAKVRADAKAKADAKAEAGEKKEYEPKPETKPTGKAGRFGKRREG